MGNASAMIYQDNNDSTYKSYYKTNEKLLDLFSILPDKDKNIMIDYITNSLYNVWNKDYYLFLVSLQQNIYISDSIKNNLITNLDIIKENKNTNTCEKFKYIHNMILSINKEVSDFCLLDYNKRDTIINLKVESFTKNGDFETYLLLDKLKYKDNMFQKISTSIDQAIKRRNYYAI
ncbi:SWPV1-281 [Shearwaterpox virus]|uniref:SWPV1-281 n=1 Tax=Shearwaterpox virus TaxID=1974596 RepID=A0A1V0S890_CNPV|nr:SWPV1-281 [Shearwaterpox virus]